MSRSRQGKRSPLTAAEKEAKADRNKRRGRSPRERAWEREHIIREHKDPVHSVTTVQTRSKASRLKEAMRIRFHQEAVALNEAEKERRALGESRE